MQQAFAVLKLVHVCYANVHNSVLTRDNGVRSSMMLLTIWCGGGNWQNNEETLKFCFDVYDLNGDGTLSRDEVTHMLKVSGGIFIVLLGFRGR